MMLAPRPPRRLFATVLIVLLTAGATARADTLLQYVDDDGHQSQILVRGEIVRMDLNEAVSGTTGYMLFDTGDRTLTVVDDGDRTYLPLTAERMDAYLQTMTDMAGEIRRQMDQLPPEVREQLREQIGLGPEGFEAEITTRTTDPERDLGEYTCRELEILIDNRSQSTVCITDARTLGIPDADFRALDRLMERLHELSLRALEAGGPMAAEMGGSLLPKVDGIPLEVREHGGTTTQLRAVSTDPLGTELFTIPDSYGERDLF
ncbi:MAG: hypothetical protein ACQETK_03810 [Pseudomonadota bacterium]